MLSDREIILDALAQHLQTTVLLRAIPRNGAGTAAAAAWCRLRPWSLESVHVVLTLHLSLHSSLMNTVMSSDGRSGTVMIIMMMTMREY